MAENVKVVISGEDKASPSIKSVSAQLTALGKSSGIVKAAMKELAPYIGGGALLFGMKKIINMAAEEEQQMKSLEIAVNLTGESFANVSGDIDRFISSMQATTAYGDGEMRPVLQQITLLTGDLSKGFEGARLAADIAASGLFDIGSASRYVAMAMEGEVTMLGRYIPQLKQIALEQAGIKTQAEKAEYAMRILNEKFGGIAAKSLDTYADRVQQFKNYLGDLGEAIGKLALPALTNLAAGFADIAKKVNVAITTIDSTILTVSTILPNVYEMTDKSVLDLENRLKTVNAILEIDTINASSAATQAIKNYRSEIIQLIGEYENLKKQSEHLKEIQEFTITFTMDPIPDPILEADIKSEMERFAQSLPEPVIKIKYDFEERMPIWEHAKPISEEEFIKKFYPEEMGERFAIDFTSATQAGLQASFSTILRPFFNSMGASFGNSFAGQFIQAFMSQLMAQLATKLALTLLGGGGFFASMPGGGSGITNVRGANPLESINAGLNDLVIQRRAFL